MQIVSRFDFDGDNFISPDEVFILLSYIPFKHPQKKQSSVDLQEPSSPLRKAASTGDSAAIAQVAEGIYTANQTMNEEQRTHEQREIKSFVTQAFQEVSRFTIEQFLEFNSQISSEMFCSVMSILQERLPCAYFYFR